MPGSKIPMAGRKRRGSPSLAFARSPISSPSAASPTRLTAPNKSASNRAGGRKQTDSHSKAIKAPPTRLKSRPAAKLRAVRSTRTRREFSTHAGRTRTSRTPTPAASPSSSTASTIRPTRSHKSSSRLGCWTGGGTASAGRSGRSKAVDGPRSTLPFTTAPRCWSTSPLTTLISPPTNASPPRSTSPLSAVIEPPTLPSICTSPLKAVISPTTPPPASTATSPA